MKFMNWFQDTWPTILLVLTVLSIISATVHCNVVMWSTP